MTSSIHRYDVDITAHGPGDASAVVHIPSGRLVHAEMVPGLRAPFIWEVWAVLSLGEQGEMAEPPRPVEFRLVGDEWLVGGGPYTYLASARTGTQMWHLLCAVPRPPLQVSPA